MIDIYTIFRKLDFDDDNNFPQVPQNQINLEVSPERNDEIEFYTNFQS